MFEFEDVYSKEDKFLINEYLKVGTDDFLIAGVGDKIFVVPYKYTINKTPEQAIENFKEDLLEFQRFEQKKYENANRIVRRVYVDNESYVVPFDLNKSITPKEAVEHV